MTIAGVSTPLNEDARNTLREYVHASDEMDAWKERKQKARDALVAFLAVHEADEGTIDGKTVCRVRLELRETLDVKRLTLEEPFTARRFTRASTVESFRLVGR